MTGDHRLEVADVLRSCTSAFLASYGRSLSGDQRRVLSDLPRCRTAALGAHRMQCDRCGHQELAYNSCRNRHCPKCQAAARAEWLAARAADLLDVEYFHVVLTLPAEIGPIALQNKRLLYGMLLRSAADTLLTIARDPKHLGAHTGFLTVLHTWTRDLRHHPHIHCVIPGGGLSPDGRRWVPCRPGFFLPVRVLSRLFRGKFLAALDQAFKQGELTLTGKLASLCQPEAWHRFLEPLRHKEWVVYSKPPFGGPEQVLKYLARYTHRVAIANQRLVALRDDQVTFRIKADSGGTRQRTITLSAVDFIRRFLLHVLPRGFVRIRHYGILANCVRRQRLALCRQLLEQHPQDDEELLAGEHQHSEPNRNDRTEYPCPACRKGRMILVEMIEPTPATRERPPPMLASCTSSVA